MTQFQLYLFGRFRMYSPCNAEVAIDSRKAQELFIYLFLYRHRPHRREALATMLWPEQTESRAKQYLRKALWQLQACLGPLGETAVQADADWLRYTSPADIWIDVLVLEAAFRLLRGWGAGPLQPEQVATLREALDLYGGELMEGWYEDWCLCERERLQHLYLTINDHLMRHYEATGEFEVGISHGLTILAYDRAREQTHRQLMRLRYRAGDRTGALRQYELCREVLQRELQVAPGRRTEALVARIRRDEVATAAPRPVQAPLPAPAQSPLYALVEELGQLQQLLATVQQHLAQQLKPE